MIGIIYPDDNWILNKIGKELVLAGGLDNKRSKFTYWVNWCYWKIKHPDLPKSKFDIIFFTHFDEHSNKYIDVFDKADMIVCMSLHGNAELLKHGIGGNIKICPYFGVSTSVKNKITIGTSGRQHNRKNWQEIEKLKAELNPDVFKFVHKATTDDAFFMEIDYFLQASTIEGGSMDVLNAIYARVPVVSRDVGFICSYKTDTDFIYSDYNQLLDYFKIKQDAILKKDNYSKDFTWDNFKCWHQELFKELISTYQV